MFTVVLALIQIPTFTNVCTRVRLNVCVFLNTATSVYGTDASVKICVNSNMDINTIILLAQMYVLIHSY